MVAIVLLNPFQALSRKIGYSVGLENLKRNADLLVDRYATQANVTLADWREIVLTEIGRREPAVDHIANFFSSLNLIKIISNELHVLYGLDCLSIVYRFLEDKAKYQTARDSVLLQLLIEADADVFLNCLAAEFQREPARDRLKMMVESKWAKISSVLLNADAKSRAWDVISIKSQPAPKGGTKATARPSPFARRTEPLNLKPQRTTSLAEATRDFEVLDSYLDKVVPTRKAWAKDLGLYADSGLTGSGRELLAQMSKIGLEIEKDAFGFWPYPHDLAQLRISHKDLGSVEVEPWALNLAIIKALGASIEAREIVDSKEESVITLLRTLYTLYREGSRTRGSIRHQIPIYILRPAYAAIALANGSSVINLPALIEKEIRGSKRRFDRVNIRGTEGALVFRS